jgi:hypothetical protein
MFGRRSASTIGLLGIQQILSVGGALTLANMVKELVAWAEVLKAIFEGWSEFVQYYLWPVAVFLFGWAFELIQIELTPFWKDYVTIGILFSLGFFRHFVLLLRRIDEESDADLEEYGDRVLIPFPVYLNPALKWTPFVLALLSPLAWPITLCVFMVIMLAAQEGWRFVLYGLVSVFLPFIYLGFLVAFNGLVLH